MKVFTPFYAILLFFHVYAVAQCPSNAGISRIICSGGNVIIGPNSPDPSLTYSWSPVTGLSDPNSANPYAYPDVTTTYTLTVYGCPTYAPITVSVADHIYVTTPTGSIVHGTREVGVYFPTGQPEPIVFHSASPNTQWFIYPSNVVRGTGTIYTYNYAGSITTDSTISIATKDDNNNSCFYTDLRTVTSHACSNVSQYPVSPVISYYKYGTCGPTLPATITQPTTLGAGTTYEWGKLSDPGSLWTITSPSGNSATLNHSTSTTISDSSFIYTRAANVTLWGGLGEEIWMKWRVKYSPNLSCAMRKAGLPQPANDNGNNITDHKLLALYPNPAIATVTITSPDFFRQVEVSDMTGKVVKTAWPGRVKSYVMATHDLAAGTYVCKIILSDNSTRYTRLIVTR